MLRGNEVDRLRLDESLYVQLRMRLVQDGHDALRLDVGQLLRVLPPIRPIHRDAPEAWLGCGGQAEGSRSRQSCRSGAVRGRERNAGERCGLTARTATSLHKSKLVHEKSMHQVRFSNRGAGALFSKRKKRARAARARVCKCKVARTPAQHRPFTAYIQSRKARSLYCRRSYTAEVTVHGHSLCRKVEVYSVYSY